MGKVKILKEEVIRLICCCQADLLNIVPLAGIN